MNRKRLLNHILVVIIAFAAATIVCVVLAFRMTESMSDRLVERADQMAEAERARQQAEREQQINALIASPETGTTREQIEALSIGMTGEEVQETLEYPYSLGIEMFPYSYRYRDHTWVVNDIPVKDVGYVEAVFIDRQLVGLGSLDPAVGRMCRGCLERMLSGERNWLAGLPYQVDGKCPECGSTELLPYGVTLDQLHKSLHR